MEDELLYIQGLYSLLLPDGLPGRVSCSDSFSPVSVGTGLFSCFCCSLREFASRSARVLCGNSFPPGSFKGLLFTPEVGNFTWNVPA